MKKLTIIFALAVTSCALNNDELVAVVKDRASFDLNCPKDKLNATVLKEQENFAFMGPKNGSVGVEGCGLRRTYVIDERKNIYAEGVIPTK